MALPAITSITPSTGPAAGGTLVTIAGSGFTDATAVLFGDASATAISVVGDTVIVVTSPIGSGAVNISVATPAGTSAIGAASLFAFQVSVAAGASSVRVPPPRNITEVGGYLNLLTNLEGSSLLEQTLAEILGVAGPTPPLG